MGANANSGNNNSNDQQREDMNDKSSQFNDERCSRKLGGNDDTTDVDELQSFSTNFSFWDVPMTNVKYILKAPILECTHKDKDWIKRIELAREEFVSRAQSATQPRIRIRNLREWLITGTRNSARQSDDDDSI